MDSKNNKNEKCKKTDIFIYMAPGTSAAHILGMFHL